MLLRYVVVFFLSTLAVAQTNRVSDADFLKNVLFPATTILYSQDIEGGMKMRCTATAIEKNATGYVFVTAAHCSCEDNSEKRTVSAEKDSFFYITEDANETKIFHRAVLQGCGYRTRGDDFALFQVDTKLSFPIVALGHDPKTLDEIINVASPQGLGKQVFLGSVSAAKLERPAVDKDINWSGAILLQMFGVNGGSSGSSFVCRDQQAICGFVVGGIGDTTMVGMPVSRLIELRKELAAGTYKYWKPEVDAGDKK